MLPSFTPESRTPATGVSPTITNKIKKICETRGCMPAVVTNVTATVDHARLGHQRAG
jgi:hypothetical protein